jgi:uncharacterized protein (TIGR00725 family)
MGTEKYATTFGGSEYLPGSQEYQDGIRLGAFLASRGYIVKNGGYYGLMEAVAIGVANANGRSIGVLNGQFEPKPPNKYVTEVIRENDLFDRLRTLIKDSELFLFQHGSIGTLEELMSVWCLRYTLHLNGVRICLIGSEWKHLLTGLRMLSIKKEEFDHLELFDSLEHFFSQFE